MKKLIALISISFVLLVSCDEENISILVRRTITKNIVLYYDINNKGSFSSSSFINSYDIIRQFDDNAGFLSSEIEKLDINSFSFGAEVDARNTAQSFVINAILKQICMPGIPCQDIKILDDTKTIQIQSNTAQDLLNGIGAVVGVDKKNITLHNAIDAVNATGAAAIKKVLEGAFKENKSARIDINLNGKVPNNQQAILKCVIVMNASLTYLKCEPKEIGFFFGGDEKCK